MRNSKSTTPLSQAAMKLIVSYEVTSELYYSAHSERPTWPGGSSGVTIGVGYDLGYEVAADFEEDWAPYLDSGRRAHLALVLGSKGPAAAKAIANVDGVRVCWAEAVAEFTEQSAPRTVGQTEGALANTGELSSDSLGALVSLVYNRGASFKAAGPRYLEMRTIKGLMDAKQYALIPDQIRAMKRLWPAVAGLQRRRDAEADLFQAGFGA